MAEEAKTAQATPGTAASAPSGGGSKIVTILMIVNSLLLAGVLAMLVLRPAGLTRAKAPEGAPAEHAEAKEGEAKEEEHAKKEEKGEKAEGKEHAGKSEKGEGGAPAAGATTVRLPDFIVHLRDADSDRYARVSFEVELKEEKGKEVITGRLPQVRDAFLAYLSDRTVDELRGSEAMAQMKEALAKRLHDIAPGAPVRALYVTDLVIQ